VDGLGPLTNVIIRAFRHSGHVFHQVQVKVILRDEEFLSAAARQRQ